nr:MAG TPA: hypothetical protein [Caudoviricetes sp.]
MSVCWIIFTVKYRKASYLWSIAFGIASSWIGFF